MFDTEIRNINTGDTIFAIDMTLLEICEAMELDPWEWMFIRSVKLD